MPVTVTEVTFDPAIWTDGFGGTGAGTNGFDAWTVYPDRDGVTCWAFEYDAFSFGRFNLSDGSIVHQGNFITPSGFNLIQKLNAHDTTLWAQDASNHYYVLDGDGVTVIKFHIAPGPAGNLMNGYCVVDATFSLATMTPSPFGNQQWEDMVAINSGGVNYLVFVSPQSGTANIWIVNVDTMTAVGTYTNASFGYFQTFVDKFGDIWFCGNNNATGDSFIKWHPANGATAGHLNVTVNFVANSTIGFNGSQWFTYVPATHSVFIAGGSQSANFTVPCANIDLTSFTRNAFHADDLSFFFAGWNTNQYGGASMPGAAMDVGTLSSGLLGIPGTLNPNTTQAAGILNMIDPTTLVLTPNSTPITVLVTYGGFGGSPVYIIQGLQGASAYNLTSIINGSGVATPIRTITGSQSVPSVMWAIVQPAANFCGGMASQVVGQPTIKGTAKRNVAS